MTSTRSAATSAHIIDQVVEAYERIGIPPKFSPAQSKLLIGTWRAVAEGSPVTPERIAAIAAESGIKAEEATEFLGWMSEKDGAGNILGAVGLTQTDWSSIKFRVEGRELHAWCALDTFFLPLMLNKVVDVEVPAASGSSVKLRIGPERAELVEPKGATMTTVVPTAFESAGIEAVEGIWNIFCQHSLYFPSREEAERFADERRDLGVRVLSIEDAYEVAKRSFAGLRQYAV